MFRSSSIQKKCKTAVIILTLLVMAIPSQPGAFASSQASLAPSANEGHPMAVNAPDFDLPLPNIYVETPTISGELDGKCDLYEALQAVFQANSGGSPDYMDCKAKANAMNIIGFSLNTAASTITIPPGMDLPFIYGETVIVGPIAIQGSPGKDTHIFQTGTNAKLTLVAVSLKNSYTTGSGPAIHDVNHASITVIGSFFTNNVAESTGGAIDSNGELSLIGTSFISNRATGENESPGLGGAVYMSGVGSFKSEASTFTGNQAIAGGAIYLEKNEGKASINDSIFTGNSVGGNPNNLGGGAVFNSAGILEIQRSAFNANIGLQGQGGALVNNINATAAITSTLFDGNLAGDTGSAMDGGAIKNLGRLKIASSTFLSNFAQGGNGGAIAASNGAVSIANTTFSANIATVEGGALHLSGSTTATILNSTFENNIAAPILASAILSNDSTEVRIGNTIIDGLLSPLCSMDGVISLGHNIARDTSCVSAASDQQGVDPKLGGLAFNGGGLPVLTTHMPAHDSPAVDYGDSAICNDPAVHNEDATGTKRPKDANHTGSQACDVGAVEVPPYAPHFDAMPLPPGPLNFGSVEVNTDLTTSFTVKNTGTFKLTISDPNLGDTSHFNLSDAFPIEIEPAQEKVITLSCHPTSVGLLESQLSFSSNDTDKPEATYSLLCEGTPTPQPVFASLPALPASLEFGVATVGDIAASDLTIINIGKASLTIESVTWSGASDISPNFPPTPFSITPGNQQIVTPTCTPSQIGLLTGQLTLTTNDPSQPTVAFNLNCAGAQPSLADLANTQNLHTQDLTNDLTNPFGVAFSSDGQNAYVVGNHTIGGQVITLKKGVLDDGIDGYEYAGFNSHSSLNNTHGIAVSPDDRYVLVTGAVSNAIVFYQRDSGSGSLTYLGSAQNGSGGVSGMEYPLDVDFSPDGRFVYVAGSHSDSIAIFEHDESAPTKFSFVGAVTATSDGAHPLNDPVSIAISPDGKNLYVTVYTDDPDTTGTLAVYQRNLLTGELTPIQTRWQWDTQDTATCPLCFPMVGLRGAFGVAVSPDGANVYVTGAVDGSLITFIRDPATGEVHLPYAFLEGVFGVSGLAGARGVAVSPDGKHVYVVATTDETLVEFKRDTKTHLIWLNQEYPRDTSGVPALGHTVYVAVSPDGNFVIATGAADNAVAVFQTANPQPTLYALLPASSMETDESQTITVKGAGFIPGAQVTFDQVPLETTYVNETEVETTIPAGWLNYPAEHSIRVVNPAPGGGKSFNYLVFEVFSPLAADQSFAVSPKPIPSISFITPVGAKAGAESFMMDIYGANFQAASEVWVNNVEAQNVQFVSSTHLRLMITEDLLAQAGTLSIKVSNGTDADSNTASLFVCPPGWNPAPTITGISPAYVLSPRVNSSPFTITITGMNFVEGATVQWNGSDRPTQFIDSTHLQVTISTSDQLWPPTLNSISVTNPLPGGGRSNLVSFTVYLLHQVFLPIIMR